MPEMCEESRSVKESKVSNNLTVASNCRGDGLRGSRGRRGRNRWIDLLDLNLPVKGRMGSTGGHPRISPLSSAFLRVALTDLQG